MGKVRVQELARMMGISNQDLVFKLKSIGVRVEGDDAHIDTDIISAILQGKKLPNPREVTVRDDPAQVRPPPPNPLRPVRVASTPSVQAPREPRQDHVAQDVQNRPGFGSLGDFFTHRGARGVSRDHPVAPETFDVLLSHNSKDKAGVREIFVALQDRGLCPWLDEECLVPGRRWQDALEEVIATIPAAVVLVGRDGIGPWEDVEMRAVLFEFVGRKLPVIPVLLPSDAHEPRLPLFLRGFTWVDLRSGLTQDGIDRLVWGITGKRPRR